MKFVTARELRLNPKGVWKKIQADSINVITINGKPCFLLTKLAPEELEEVIYIQKRLRAELALSQMQKQAAATGADKLTSEQIDGIIKKARLARKR